LRRRFALTRDKAAFFMGVASAGSGLAMIRAPFALARLYSLPRRAALVRALGARDVVIGCQLLLGDRRRGLVARALADLTDVTLMLLERKQRPTPRPGLGRLVGAVSSAALALALVPRTSPQTARRLALPSASNKPGKLPRS
jgi:hypothetical protein